MNKSGPPSEENQALAANARKGKGRKFPFKKNKDKRLDSDRERRPRDMSKVKCFNCLKFGDFAANRPDRRKRRGKQHASVADVDDD